MSKQSSSDMLSSIDGIKTGFMGYNKEAVLEYILALLKKMEETKEEELSQLSDKVTDLERDNKRLKGQIEIYKENYGMLSRQLDEMSRAWEQNVQYAAQRDSLLREYQRKEASIQECLDEAEQRSKNIMDDATKNRSRILKQVHEECDELVRREREKVTMCKLELAKIVCQLTPMLKDEAYGEAVRIACAERE